MGFRYIKAKYTIDDGNWINKRYRIIKLDIVTYIEGRWKYKNYEFDRIILKLFYELGFIMGWLIIGVVG